MKNLKRALSLALASVMVLGMMVVGASAAEFNDADKIENTDAVNTLVALNILKGKDTGAFDPEGIVTRAEMTKMICVAMNGGRDPNLTGGGTYPDTKGHWASGYIDYCSNLKIVSGDTAGNFNPDKTITGTEAAKMILIALGFSAENEKFVNDAAWATNIGVRASQKDLYADLAILPAEGLTRDNAAQMLWNGLQATMVRYQYQLGTSAGDLTSIAIAEDNGTKTILSEKFKMETKYGYLTGWSYDDKKAEYNYSFTTTAGVYGPVIGTDPIGISLKTTKDFTNLFGMKVKTLYKLNDDKTVYGFYADSAVLAAGVWGDATDKADTLKFDGTTYDKNANYGVRDYRTGTVATMKDEYTFKAIDNNDDGKVDVTVAMPFAVAKVTFVGKDAITAGNVSYKFEDCTIYEGVAKDDIVMITAKANAAKDIVTIAKTEKVSGDITAVNADGEKRVDGTWYAKAGTAAPTGGATYSDLTAGDTVDFFLANGYVAYAKLGEGSVTLSNVLYVVDSKNHATATTAPVIAEALGGTYKGEDHLVLLADGTKSTVKAMRVDVTTVTTGISAADSDLVKIEAAPGLYTYKVNKDGVYELKAAKGSTSTQIGTTGNYVFAAANQPSSTEFETASAGYTKDDGKLDSKYIADDAVIYLNTTSPSAKQKVITGKDLKNLGTFGTAATYLFKSVSGLPTIQVAAITGTSLIPGTSTSDGYGYVTAAGYAEKNADDEWIVKFTVWNGTEEVELIATDADNTDAGESRFTKGAFVSYTNTSVTGEVTDVSDILGDSPNTLANGAQTAITGWDGSKNIAFDASSTAEFKDNDKTVVIYVNTADKKGIEGGSIETAEKLADGVFVKNAVAIVDAADDEVVVLFVDTANKLAGATYGLTWTSSDLAAVNGVDVSGYSVTDDKNAAVATGTAVKGGSTLKVVVAGSGTATAATTITVTVTLADVTTIVKTIPVADGAAFSGGTVTFTMPYQAVTGIVVTVA